MSVIFEIPTSALVERLPTLLLLPIVRSSGTERAVLSPLSLSAPLYAEIDAIFAPE